MRRIMTLGMLFSLAFLTQSFIIPKKVVPGTSESREVPSHRSTGNGRITPAPPQSDLLIEKKTVVKSSKTKLAPQKKYRRAKVPFLVKLGLVFLGIGLVFLLASFWGWVFTYVDGLASWISISTYIGAGSVGVGLICLIISWLSA